MKDCFHQDFVFEHLGAVSEVAGVQDGAEEPVENEHDGAGHVVGRNQGHRDVGAFVAERNFVRNFQLKRDLKR